MAKRLLKLPHNSSFFSHSYKTLAMIDKIKMNDKLIDEAGYDELHSDLMRHNSSFYKQFFSATVQAEKYNVGDITLDQLGASLLNLHCYEEEENDEAFLDYILVESMRRPHYSYDNWDDDTELSGDFDDD